MKRRVLCIQKLFPCFWAALAGCASTPLEKPEAQKVAELAALPRTICIEVQSGEPTFGDDEEWSSTLVSVFKELKVASEVWRASERNAEDADMVVRVALAQRSPSSPETDTQGALLDFLAWSTIPLLPSWIEDVHIDPGLRITVNREFAGDKEGNLSSLFNSPVIKTSFRDRYPWLSWTSLGALLVPPFVFAEGEGEHLRECIAERVRLEVAVRVAEFLKKEPPGEEELLSSFAVTQEDGKPLLEYEASPEMGKLIVWLDGEGSERTTEKIPFSEKTVRGRFPLTALLSGAGEERLLRLEAIHRADGRRFRYSLPIPDAIAAEERS